MKKYFIYILIAFLLSSFSIVFSQERIGIHQADWEKYGSNLKENDKSVSESINIIPLQKNIRKELSSAVFGYLPDWEYNDGSQNLLRYDLLTHVACFDFMVSSTGSVGNPSNWPWTDVVNDAHAAGTKVILTAVNFYGDQIHNIITDDSVKHDFFDNIKNKIVAYSMDGVNIDFESLENDDKGAPINNFMAELTDFIHTELPGKEVSFAGPAVNWGDRWDLDGLVQSCDYVFIMGYAFWGKWSTTSGPNAPLVGFTHDITSTVTDDYGVPVSKYPEKIILGVPYYGHEWITETGNAYTETIEFIESTRFKNAQPESELHGAIWDSRSETPWYNWNDGTWHQVWYDDFASLGLKYDLATNHNLKGVGMWALGYDGTRQELWNLIDFKFGSGEIPIPNTPSSFHVMIESNLTITANFEFTQWADNYTVFISENGLDFEEIKQEYSNKIYINQLRTDSVYYLKVTGSNSAGSSYPTEVLGGIPSINKNDILIVNGFDRTGGTNNTFDFIRFYGKPLIERGYSFSSASNEAVYKELIDLKEYELVIWMLLDESTTDDTFNPLEQELVAEYLESGGKLLVTGAEVGWDLVEKGNSTDLEFYQTYLKANYISDAPNENQSGTYYTANSVAGEIFDDLGDINFDNGNHGTIDVDWPDAINAIEGAVNILNYKNNPQSNEFAGIAYTGLFTPDTQPGKIIYLAVPFETIYPAEMQLSVMERILDYFDLGTDIEDEIVELPVNFELKQNYPNPFNPSTKIKYNIPSQGYVVIKVFDSLGRIVAELVNEEKSPGNYSVEFNASNLASGVYFYNLISGQFSDTKKMMLIR